MEIVSFIDNKAYLDPVNIQNILKENPHGSKMYYMKKKEKIQLDV